MTQRQAVFAGQVIDDDVMNRAVPCIEGVYEGMVPSISGAGGTAGWLLTMNTGARGVSTWRATGTGDKGRVQVEETSPVYVAIPPPNALPRIDLVVGIHRWVQADLDPQTGLPTGVFLPAMDATYMIVSGIPATIPVMPDIPAPFDSIGNIATILARVNIGPSANNTCLVERWDPTDWTWERRGIPQIATFQVSNPAVGVDTTPYTWGIVTSAAPSLDFDYANNAILAMRTGYYRVEFTAEAAGKLVKISKKGWNEASYSLIHSTTGRATPVLQLTQGDRLVFGGDSGAGTMIGTFEYLGMSSLDQELMDPANTFTITNADVVILGDQIFPYSLDIPITNTGATAPITWRVLPGTDLPGPTFSGDHVLSSLLTYGAWTLSLYGKDNVGKFARKNLRVSVLPSQIVIDTPQYLLLGSSDGQPWDSLAGTTWGFASTQTGFIKTVTIAHHGGIAPYLHYGHSGINLLNPAVDITTGVGTLFVPAQNQGSGSVQYVGEVATTCTVNGAFGSTASANINVYSARVHLRAGGTGYLRVSSSHIKVAKGGGANMSLTFATGTPASTQFSASGTHVWSVDGTLTTLVGAAPAATTTNVNILTAPWPTAGYGTYTLRVVATITVAGNPAPMTASETIIVDYLPHGALGFVFNTSGATPLGPLAPNPGNLLTGPMYFAGNWWMWGSDTTTPTSPGIYLYKSTDQGATWTKPSITFAGSGASPSFNGMLMGKCGALAIVGTTSTADPHTLYHTSTDMITWTPAGSVSQFYGSPIPKYNGTVYMVAVRTSSGYGTSYDRTSIFTTTNPMVWSTTPIATLPFSITIADGSSVSGYNGGWNTGGGVFIAISNTNVAVSDASGAAWTISSIPSGRWCTPIWLPLPGLWYIQEYSLPGSDPATNRYLTSPDGVNWTMRYLPVSGRWQNPMFTGTVVLLIDTPPGTGGAGGATGGNYITLTTADGASWWQGNTGLTTPGQWGQANFGILGADGAVYTGGTNGDNFLVRDIVDTITTLTS